MPTRRLRTVGPAMHPVGCAGALCARPGKLDKTWDSRAKGDGPYEASQSPAGYATPCSRASRAQCRTMKGTAYGAVFTGFDFTQVQRGRQDRNSDGRTISRRSFDGVVRWLWRSGPTTHRNTPSSPLRSIDAGFGARRGRSGGPPGSSTTSNRHPPCARCTCRSISALKAALIAPFCSLTWCLTAAGNVRLVPDGLPG